MLLAISVAFLGLWIMSKENKALAPKVGLLFFLSFFIFIGYSYFQSFGLITFLPKLIVSCVLLAIAGVIINATNENKIAQWLIIAFASASVFQFESKISALFSHQDDTNLATSAKLSEFLYDPKGEIIIQIEPKSLGKLNLWLKKENISIRKAFSPQWENITELDNYYILDIADGSKTKELLTQLKQMNKIDWAEGNEVITMEFPQKNEPIIHPSATISNDPSVKMQWHLQYLEMEKYYQLFREKAIVPTKKAKLYILDTGIDTNHEDLNNPSGNKDKQGHGTHCAGVATAITNNGIGVASMVPTKEWVNVYGIQVIGDAGFGTQGQIIAGIIKAADDGADVISMSLGSITNQSREKAYNDAVRYANHKGAIVVVAAGNANLDGLRYSPANTENVITVTSINERNEKSGFSNHVQNLSMGLAAPGERILSTTPSNSYTSFNGTSMAAPQVAGLLAVMKAIRPSITTQEAFKILNATGKETKNTLRTGRLINPVMAISKVLE